MQLQPFFLAAFCGFMLPLPAALAQTGIGGPGAVYLPSQLDTLSVDHVEVEFTGTSAGGPSDAQTQQAVRKITDPWTPGTLSRQYLDKMLEDLRCLPGVASVSVEVRPHSDSGQARAALRVIVALQATAPPSAAPAPSANASDAFPVLYRAPGTKITTLLGGGHGAFVDGNPWFGDAYTFTVNNPLVQNPAIGADTGSTAAWVESWIELGLGGVTQIGDTNSAVYGAVSAIAVASRGQDIFRDDPRESVNIEKAYAGFLWSSEDKQQRLNLSLGRQNFSLNDGFLISMFGSQSNAGPRPGIYLAPRTTLDHSFVGNYKHGEWAATAFYLDPNEYEPIESHTRLAGANLRYGSSSKRYADITYVQAVNSNSKYSTANGVIGTRDGLRTWGIHARQSGFDAAPNLWLEGELAHQTHARFSMNAKAGYGTVGYIARHLPWTPSISYRYSYFGGDDPNTATYERFDPLFSGGLSEWLQGISLSKAIKAENRASHRVRLNLAPTQRLNLTLDWFMHKANELNNYGGSPALAVLQSKDLAKELQFTARWAISKHLFFLGIASVAFPGDAIKLATQGNAKNWSTLQAQLFWSF